MKLEKATCLTIENLLLFKYDNQLVMLFYYFAYKDDNACKLQIFLLHLT